MLRVSEKTARLVVRWLAGLGAIVFGLLLALTFVSRIHYEQAARGFLENEIERRLSHVAERAPDGAAGRLQQVATVLAEHNREEADALRRTRDSLRGAVVDTVGRLQDPSCACREQLRRGLDSITQSRLEILDSAAPHLQRVIARQYAGIVADLLAEIRIFAGTNLLAFLALLILSFTRYAGQLFLPGLLLAASTIAASAFYLFSQNWFFTILQGRYLGYAYGLWLLAVFALLCDVLLFKARFTRNVLKALPVPAPC